MNALSWRILKPFVIQFAFFGAMGVLIWFGAGPLMGEIQDAQNRLQELAVLSEHRDRQMRRLPELQERYDFIVANKERLDIVLSKEDIVEFIRTLETLATQTAVSVTITSRDNTFLESKVTEKKKTDDKTPASGEDTPSAKKKGSEKKSGILGDLPLPNPLRLSVEVVGRYPDVVQYLHKTETLPIALDVIGLTLREHEEEREADRSIPAFSAVPVPVDGQPAPAPPAPAVFRVEADFDTVLYLKSL